ncbi:MAG: glycosyltransferase [Candidatus Eisenbacteria bacterium]|nr:glycosyltransferase [Candidatus Eisenbacteria bacterium]
MRDPLTGPAEGRDERPAALFFLPTLEAGGAERVCLHHVNGLRRFRPIVLVQHLRGDLLDELDPGVPVHVIGDHGRGPAPRKRTRGRLRRALRRRRRRAVVRFRRFKRRLCLADSRLRARTKERCGPRTTRLIEEAERVFRASGWRLRAGFVFFFVGWTGASRGRSRDGRAAAQQGWSALPLCVCFLLKQARLLARFAREERCVLVVSILPFTNGIAILAKLLFHRRLRVLIHVHSMKSRLIREETPPHERFLIRLVVKHLYGRADRIVAASEGIRRDLVERFGVPDGKIRVVPNPIDRERLLALAAETPEENIFGNGRPVVAAVGRLVRVKGFDILLRAFALLPEGIGARLVLVGDGAERPLLEKIAEEEGIAGRVLFAGFRANPWAYMARARCLVLSSRTEGLPLVLGEAIALGVPVVAADCSPGVREFVPDENHGLLAPPEDPAALAVALERMLADGALRERVAARADERVRPYEPARVRAVFEREMEEASGR